MCVAFWNLTLVRGVEDTEDGSDLYGSSIAPTALFLLPRPTTFRQKGLIGIK